MKKTYTIFFFLLFCMSRLDAQLIIDTTATASQLAQKLVGAGVTISNPVLTCSPSSSGKFTNGGSTQLGIADGIMLTNGTAVQIDSPYDFLASTNLLLAGDLDLDNLLYSIGAMDTSTFDGCVLEFDVNPLGDTLSFTYVFGSEEYENFTCSMFTDVFAFFISGPNPAGGNYVKQNIALIPGTNLPVSINSVNGGAATDTSSTSGVPCISLAYSSDFVWDSTICYSGSTVPLRAVAAVLPCHTYHLKLAVADVGDGNLDTGVFIEGGSLSSNGLPTVKSIAIDGGLNYAVRNCADATITLKNTPPSTLPLTIHLLIGGTAINSTDYSHLVDSVVFPANDSLTTLTISPLSYAGAQSGKTVTIYLLSNACGGLPYDSVTITINDSINLHAGPAQNICQGASVSLGATGTPSCHWSPGATLSDSTILNPIASPSVTTTYVATFTVGVCVASDSTVVTVSPPPNGGPNDTVCLNNPALLAAVGSGSWSVPTGNPAAASLTNPNSPNTSVTGLSVSGVYRFVWSTGSGCSDTVRVLVSPGPILNVANTAICPGGSATLTASPSQTGGTYSWSPGGDVTQSITVSPATTAVYTVTYVMPSASNCASVSAYDTVTVHQPATLSVNNQTICGGASATLTASPSYTGGTYSWSPGGEVTQSITVSPTTNTTYTVVYTLNGCVPVIDSGIVSISSPTISDTLTDITCHGLNNGSISVYIVNCNNCTYQWSNSSDSSALINLSPGNYTLTVTDQSGCIVTTSYTINNPVPASLSIIPNDSTVIEDSLIRFNPLFGPYPSSSIVSYDWSPAQGLSCTSCPQPVFSAASGYYSYSLVITYNKGCQVSDTVKVIVVSQHIIYIPNAFTPNGDGINDVFQVFPRGGVKYLNLTVFNRWGEKVFETLDQGKGWDGTFKGKLQEPEVFVYYLRITFDDGYSTYQKGSITLIR